MIKILAYAPEQTKLDLYKLGKITLQIETRNVADNGHFFYFPFLFNQSHGYMIRSAKRMRASNLLSYQMRENLVVIQSNVIKADSKFKVIKIKETCNSIKCYPINGIIFL